MRSKHHLDEAQPIKLAVQVKQDHALLGDRISIGRGGAATWLLCCALQKDMDSSLCEMPGY